MVGDGVPRALNLLNAIDGLSVLNDLDGLNYMIPLNGWNHLNDRRSSVTAVSERWISLCGLAPVF